MRVCSIMCFVYLCDCLYDLLIGMLMACLFSCLIFGCCVRLLVWRVGCSLDWFGVQCVFVCVRSYLLVRLRGCVFFFV